MIKKIIESKPHEANILNCLEELSELIQAVSKYERYRLLGKISELPKLRENVLEEIVDSKISLEVLIKMFCFRESELQRIYDKKMQRNIERLEK